MQTSPIRVASAKRDTLFIGFRFWFEHFNEPKPISIEIDLP